MIGLSINSQFLHLYPGTEIPFRLISPAFAAQLEDNSHTLSFNIPGDTYNENLLSNYQDPLVNDSQTVYQNATLWFGGLPFKEGDLIVNRAQGSKRSFSVRFETDSSPISPILKETKLIDLDLGGQRDIAGVTNPLIELSIVLSTYNELAVLVVNGFTYTAFWYNGLSEEALLNIFVSLINSDNINNHVDASVVGVGAAAELNLQASSGHVQLEVEIDHVDNKHPWTIESQTGLATSIHDSMIAHMNTVATDIIGTHDYAFFPVLNLDFYDNLNSDYLDYINLWDWDTNTFVKNTSAASEQWRNTAIPFVRVGYLLERICNHIGYADISTFTQEDDFKGLCLYNNISLDQERDDGVDTFNGFRSYIDVKDHIPQDATCADLIRYIRDTFNLSFDINTEHKTLEFFPKAEIPTKTLKDWREKSLVAYAISRKPENKRGYQFSYPADETDEYYQLFKDAQFQDKAIDAGSTIVSPIFPPVPGYFQPYPLGPGHWSIPTVRQAGNTVFPDVENQGYIPRIFFFRGIHPGDIIGKTYPLGAIGDVDYSETIVGNYSLSWGNEASNTEVGLLEKFWNPWYNNRTEEPEWEQALVLNLADILSLDYHVPYRLRTPSGDISSALMQLKFNLTDRGIKNPIGTFFRL